MKHFWLGVFVAVACIAVDVRVFAQGSLSSQVLRLLDRVNTWSLAQTFSVDIQVTTVNTAAPAGTACDAAGEVGKIYWDSTNDILWICSGASGWRQIATTP
jgi:hypothetical protein